MKPDLQRVLGAASSLGACGSPARNRRRPAPPLDPEYFPARTWSMLTDDVPDVDVSG